MRPVQGKIDLENKEFLQALELVQKTNQSFFLTGRAGTGKSTFLQYVREHVKKEFVVVAPTGIAAINVNGVTIHSFFRLPIRPLLPNDSEIQPFKKDSSRWKIINRMDVLVIDEASMVRADVLDAIDQSLRLNTGNKALPFGGKQVVLIGDLFQLEPVVGKNPGEQQIFTQLYPSPFFFDSYVIRGMKLPLLELKKIYRQKNREFIGLLERVRHGQPAREHLDRLNERFIRPEEARQKEFTITLTSTNAIAQRINNQQLEQLNAQKYGYEGTVSKEFEPSRFPTDLNLFLKEGAQVMFVKNDAERRWVNGTIAQVHELGDDYIKVKTDDGEIHTVQPETWENLSYEFNAGQNKISADVKGTFTQYPLKLAWAITIHKSQGLTFEKVVIDLGRGAFAGGQVYVALSRCTSFDGLHLLSRIAPRDIFIHHRIRSFSQEVKKGIFNVIAEKDTV
ncbi:MAG: DEAD/DEAH box helicase [Bacteroidia bacterium]